MSIKFCDVQKCIECCKSNLFDIDLNEKLKIFTIVNVNVKTTVSHEYP